MFETRLLSVENNVQREVQSVRGIAETMLTAVNKLTTGSGANITAVGSAAAAATAATASTVGATAAPASGSNSNSTVS